MQLAFMVIPKMKVLFIAVSIFSVIQPAFFLQTEWLFNSQSSCLSDESSQVITLSSNGAGSSYSLSVLKKGGSYPFGNNCSLEVTTSDSQLLTFNFDMLDIGPCDEDNITVESTTFPPTYFCGNTCPGSHCPRPISDIPNATISFQSNPKGLQEAHQMGFRATIIAYSKMDPKTKSCPGDDRFKCANTRCIWEGFHCDGYNHCGDGSDEPPGCAKTVWGILVIVLGVVSVCFFLPLFCYLAVWGPRRKVPVRIMGNTFFRSKAGSAINDEESVPILLGQPLQGSMPGETFTFYYGTAVNNPRC